MQKRTAQRVFIAFIVAVIPIVIFAIYEVFRVIHELRSGRESISLDSGVQYFLLGSILWVLLGLQAAGLRGKKQFVDKWGAKIALGWFVGCLILANVIPFALRSALENDGYHACVDPKEISGGLRGGRSYVYSTSPCPEHLRRLKR